MSRSGHIVEELGWEDLPSTKQEASAAPPPAVVVEPPRTGLAGARSLKDLGNTQFKDGLFDDAIASYTEALQLITLKPEPVPKRPGFPKDKKEDDKDKEPAVEEVVPPPPEPSAEESALASQLYANCALCWVKKGQHTTATPLLNRAIQHDEKYAKAYYRRGECHLVTENYSQAHGDFTKAQELGHKDPQLAANIQISKQKTDEQMAKAMGDLKQLGNTILGKFGLSLDNFKMEKDPNTGGYSVQFQNGGNAAQK